MSRRMKSRQICPEKKHQKKQNFFPVNQGCLFPGKRIRDSVLTFDSIQKYCPRQQITVMITQVIPVNGVIFKQASSHCTYPHTATASTLENIQPLSSKPLNIRDVTGINTRPSRHIISHQIRNVKKSEPRSQ